MSNVGESIENLDEKAIEIVESVAEQVLAALSEKKDIPDTGTIIEYAEYVQKTFSEDPFNEIDGLVLSQLSYFHWDEIFEDKKVAVDGTITSNESLTLNEAIGELISTNYFNSLKDDDKKLLIQIQKNPRYKDIILGNFESVNQPPKEGVIGSVDNIVQFAAMTFTFDDSVHKEPQNFVSYRGTDNSLEGWNEDFLMAFEPETQAQRRSVEYLNRIAQTLEGDLHMGGHSKGGNHSNYAFLFCDEDIRNRVVKLYSYDGPGFNDNLSYNGTPIDKDILNQMITLLDGTAIAPHDSLIGKLLVEHAFTHVETNEGILSDHNAYTWKIDLNNRSFKTTDQSEVSKYIDELADEWLFNLSNEQRKIFVNVIWEWIYSLDPDDFDAFLDGFKEAPIDTGTSLVKFIYSLPEERREEFLNALGKLCLLAAEYFLEYKVPDYNIVKEKLSNLLSSKGITDIDSFWQFIKENPTEYILDLLSELLLDEEFVDALIKLYIDIVVVAFVAKVLSIIVSTFVRLVMKYLPVIASLLAVICVLKIVVDFIREHWEDFMKLLQMAEEYIQEKITEFVEAIKLKIRSDINWIVSSMMHLTEEYLEKMQYLQGAVIDVFYKLSTAVSEAIKTVVKINNPLLYCIIRTVLSVTQSPVYVDMFRLQLAVDHMDRLAYRVQNIDNRLSSLYSRLAENNIEQEKGIFTSLVNLYNLCRADINVDEGYKIRRKADAISDTFREYKDVEQWVLEQIGG